MTIERVVVGALSPDARVITHNFECNGQVYQSSPDYRSPF